jgi:hypothetical protein
MFNVLIDTCVWLDLAQDRRQTPLLLVVENMVEAGVLRLLVPRIVIEEFGKNRARVAKTSVRSLSTQFHQVKEAVIKAGGDEKRNKELLAQLDDVSHRIPIIGGAAVGALDRIEKLLKAATIIETSDSVMLQAADRALRRRAPCHNENKNSIADAMVIETYFAAVKIMDSAGQRFAFVTHNKTDFSLVGGNQKLPHKDFAAQFSKIKSMYFINLTECLRRIDPSMVTELMWEQPWSQEPRSLSELLKAEDMLFHQVWYNRHWNLRAKIQAGVVKLVDKETYPRKPSAPETCQKDVWAGALRSAKQVEKKYGKKNLGPWDDFDWGMVNGKLSAIRWMLGDEWDMLDT